MYRDDMYFEPDWHGNGPDEDEFNEDEYYMHEESKRDWLADEKASIEPERCRKCGSISFEAQHTGPHIGLYCTKCGAWLRWIPQHNKKAQFNKPHQRIPQHNKKAQLNEPHQMSIEEFMQEAAPEQASMTNEERTEAYFGKLPWEE